LPASLHPMQPRSSSLPALTGSRMFENSRVPLPPPPLHDFDARPIHSLAEVEFDRRYEMDVERSNPDIVRSVHAAASDTRPLSVRSSQGQLSNQETNQHRTTLQNQENVITMSLRSLSQNLDDDAIDFLTSMRFE